MSFGGFVLTGCVASSPSLAGLDRTGKGPLHTSCLGYHQCMASVVPAGIAMERLAELTGRDVGDPVVSQLFDRLVLLEHLKPWIPDWWEEIRWAEAEELVSG